MDSSVFAGESHLIFGIRKIERREGREFSVHPYLKPDGYIKPAGFPDTMVAVLGFTTILGSFRGIGIWARLSCGRSVLDVPFNPTYGLSLKS